MVKLAENALDPNASETRARENKKISKAKKVSRLEEKLDNLANLLQSSSANGSQTATVTSQHGDATSATAESVILETPTLSAPSVEEESETEVEECLTRFRAQLQYFPFVHLPAEVTVSELRDSRPFLWKCIMAIATLSVTKQRALGLQIHKLAAERLVVNHERTMDLLLGLLGYLAWSNYQVGPNQLFISMYCHLAILLVQDMGLDVPPRDVSSQPLACLKAHGFSRHLATRRTMEERRALVATYLVTSEMSAFRSVYIHLNTESMRWNPQIEEALQALEEQKESPLDLRLVTMAKLRRIGSEVTLPSSLPPAQHSEHLITLQAFQANTLLGRLEGLKERLPSDFITDTVLQLQILGTELEIHAPLVHQAPPPKPVPGSQRLAVLTRCLYTTRQWLDVFHIVEPTVCAMLPFSTWAQLALVTTILYRLSLLEEQGWDKRMAQNTVDLIEEMAKIINLVQQLPSQAGLTSESASDGDPFTKMAKVLNLMKTGWEPQLRPNNNGATDVAVFDPPLSDNLDAFECLDGMNWIAESFFSWNGQ
ncbi:hypothetical protein OQA88_6053 [Cercophora sp. LCS_1]